MSMRTAITLQEFLFTLNQDEDIFVHIIDYERDERICSCWKSSLNYEMKNDFLNELKYKDWFVQYFTTSMEGLEITIVELEAELD